MNIMEEQGQEQDLRELFDDQITEQIYQLRSAAYANLSKIHREYLADLEAEARRRRIYLGG